MASRNKDLCKKHKEKLLLFCKEDEEFVCVLCQQSPEHKGHTTVLLEEAAQQHKVEISRHLETLKTKRKKILTCFGDAEKERQELLKITESEKQKTAAEFRKLRQFIQQEENRMLAQVEKVEREIAGRRKEHLARLSEEQSSLESLIREMEEKQKQPVTKLLQDVKSTLQRCEQKECLENPVAFPPELKRKHQESCHIGPFVRGVMKEFQDTLVSARQMQKANVTLDPNTAATALILSENQRRITCRKTNIYERVRNNFYSSVLGCEKFTRGCQFWEVSVGSEDGWAVGVAKSSVSLWASFTPEEGVWAVGREKGKYMALIKGFYPSLSLSGELKRIRVCLNYDGGQVAFFDADAGTLLYAFFGAPFSGQTLHPFFAVYDKGHLSLSSLDS